MTKTSKIPLPLLFNFLTEVANNESLEKSVENSFYNTELFSRIPFYKPISQISIGEKILPTKEQKL